MIEGMAIRKDTPGTAVAPEVTPGGEDDAMEDGSRFIMHQRVPSGLRVCCVPYPVPYLVVSFVFQPTS